MPSNFVENSLYRQNLEIFTTNQLLENEWIFSCHRYLFGRREPTPQHANKSIAAKRGRSNEYKRFVKKSVSRQLNSTFDSECSPKRIRLTPQEKKSRRVTFKLPPANKGQRANPDSELDEYYAEPDSPRRTSPLKPSQKTNVPPAVPERKNLGDCLNYLSEPPSPETKSARDYLNELSTREADEMVTRLALGLEEGERDVYMSVGRGRGP